MFFKELFIIIIFFNFKSSFVLCYFIKEHFVLKRCNIFYSFTILNDIVIIKFNNGEFRNTLSRIQLLCQFFRRSGSDFIDIVNTTGKIVSAFQTVADLVLFQQFSDLLFDVFRTVDDQVERIGENLSGEDVDDQQNQRNQ